MAGTTHHAGGKFEARNLAKDKKPGVPLQLPASSTAALSARPESTARSRTARERPSVTRKSQNGRLTAPRTNYKINSAKAKPSVPAKMFDAMKVDRKGFLESSSATIAQKKQAEALG